MQNNDEESKKPLEIKYAEGENGFYERLIALIDDSANKFAN